MVEFTSGADNDSDSVIPLTGTSDDSDDEIDLDGIMLRIYDEHASEIDLDGNMFRVNDEHASEIDLDGNMFRVNDEHASEIDLDGNMFRVNDEHPSEIDFNGNIINIETELDLDDQEHRRKKKYCDDGNASGSSAENNNKQIYVAGCIGLDETSGGRKEIDASIGDKIGGGIEHGGCGGDSIGGGDDGIGGEIVEIIGDGIEVAVEAGVEVAEEVAEEIEAGIEAGIEIAEEVGEKIEMCIESGIEAGIDAGEEIGEGIEAGIETGIDVGEEIGKEIESGCETGIDLGNDLGEGIDDDINLSNNLGEGVDDGIDLSNDLSEDIDDKIDLDNKTGDDLDTECVNGEDMLGSSNVLDAKANPEENVEPGASDIEEAKDTSEEDIIKTYERILEILEKSLDAPFEEGQDAITKSDMYEYLLNALKNDPAIGPADYSTELDDYITPDAKRVEFIASVLASIKALSDADTEAPVADQSTMASSLGETIDLVGDVGNGLKDDAIVDENTSDIKEGEINKTYEKIMEILEKSSDTPFEEGQEAITKNEMYEYLLDALKNDPAIGPADYSAELDDYITPDAKRVEFIASVLVSIKALSNADAEPPVADQMASSGHLTRPLITEELSSDIKETTRHEIHEPEINQLGDIYHEAEIRARVDEVGREIAETVTCKNHVPACNTADITGGDQDLHEKHPMDECENDKIVEAIVQKIKKELESLNETSDEPEFDRIDTHGSTRYKEHEPIGVHETTMECQQKIRPPSKEELEKETVGDNNAKATGFDIPYENIVSQTEELSGVKRDSWDLQEMSGGDTVEHGGIKAHETMANETPSLVKGRDDVDHGMDGQYTKLDEDSIVARAEGDAARDVTGAAIGTPDAGSLMTESDAHGMASKESESLLDDATEINVLDDWDDSEKNSLHDVDMQVHAPDLFRPWHKADIARLEEDTARDAVDDAITPVIDTSSRASEPCNHEEISKDLGNEWRMARWQFDVEDGKNREKEAAESPGDVYPGNLPFNDELTRHARENNFVTSDSIASNDAGIESKGFREVKDVKPGEFSPEHVITISPRGSGKRFSIEKGELRQWLEHEPISKVAASIGCSITTINRKCKRVGLVIEKNKKISTFSSSTELPEYVVEPLEDIGKSRAMVPIKHNIATMADPDFSSATTVKHIMSGRGGRLTLDTVLSRADPVREATYRQRLDGIKPENFKYYQMTEEGYFEVNFEGKSRIHGPRPYIEVKVMEDGKAKTEYKSVIDDFQTPYLTETDRKDATWIGKPEDKPMSMEQHVQLMNKVRIPELFVNAIKQVGIVSQEQSNELLTYLNGADDMQLAKNLFKFGPIAFILPPEQLSYDVLKQLRTGTLQLDSAMIQKFQKGVFDTRLKAWKAQSLANTQMLDTVSTIQELAKEESVTGGVLSSEAIATYGDSDQLAAWNRLSPKLQAILEAHPELVSSLTYKDQYYLNRVGAGWDLRADGVLKIESDDPNFQYREVVETKSYQSFDNGHSVQTAIRSMAQNSLNLLFSEGAVDCVRLMSARTKDYLALNNRLDRANGYTLKDVAVADHRCAVTVDGQISSDKESAGTGSINIKYAVGDKKWDDLSYEGILWDKDANGNKVTRENNFIDNNGNPCAKNDVNLVGGILTVEALAGTFSTSYADFAGQVGAMMDGLNAAFNIPGDTQFNPRNRFTDVDALGQYDRVYALSAFSQEQVSGAVDRTEALIARFAAKIPQVADWCDGTLHTIGFLEHRYGGNQDRLTRELTNIVKYGGVAHFPDDIPGLQFQRTIGEALANPYVTLVPWVDNDPNSFVQYHTATQGDVYNIPEGRWWSNGDGTRNLSAWGMIKVRVTLREGQTIDVPLCVSAYDDQESGLPAYFGTTPISDKFAPGSVYCPDTGKTFDSIGLTLDPLIQLCQQLDKATATLSSISYHKGMLSLDLSWTETDGTAHNLPVTVDLADLDHPFSAGGNLYNNVKGLFTAENIPRDIFKSYIGTVLMNRFGVDDMKGLNFRLISTDGETERYGFNLPLKIGSAGGDLKKVDQGCCIPLICDVLKDGSVTVFTSTNLMSNDIACELGTVDLLELVNRLSRCFDLSQMQELKRSVTLGFYIDSCKVNVERGIVDFSLRFSSGWHGGIDLSIPCHTNLADIINGMEGISFDDTRITWQGLQNAYHIFHEITAENGLIPGFKGVGNSFSIYDASIKEGQFSLAVYLRSAKSSFIIHMQLDDPTSSVWISSSSGNVVSCASFWLWAQACISERYNPEFFKDVGLPWIRPDSFTSSYQESDGKYHFSCITTIGGSDTLLKGTQDPVTKAVMITSYNGVEIDESCGSLLAFLECQRQEWTIDPSSGILSHSINWRGLNYNCYKLVFLDGGIRYTVYIDLATGLVLGSFDVRAGWHFSIYTAYQNAVPE